MKIKIVSFNSQILNIASQIWHYAEKGCKKREPNKTKERKKKWQTNPIK